jgi:hypothetical protein
MHAYAGQIVRDQHVRRDAFGHDLQEIGRRARRAVR